MAALYDIITTAHPLLSNKALTLKTAAQPKLEAQVQLAESLLGLAAPVETDPLRVDRVKMALALQVNWQLEYEADPFVLSSETSGIQRETISYRPDVPLVDPRAQEIIDGLVDVEDEEDLTGLWGESVRSVRGPNR